MPAPPAFNEADRRSLLGRVLQRRYRPSAVIGEGGMGTVYEAEHLVIGRSVALKVLHPGFTSESEAVRRFRHEARAAGSIGHPNICEIYDVGELDDGSPYLVMERLHGETLADRIEREGPLPLADVVDVALQVLSALAAAHDKGIVHRDVKPDNVFLAKRVGFAPLAKLLDFGISKNAAHDDLRMTRTGAVMGTPYYMAPEQARGEFIDARIDLYAVGTLVYESLTGRRPFESDDLAELFRQVLFDEPRPMSQLRSALPPAIELVVRRAIAKERTERFQTAQEFMAALADLRAELAAVRPNPSELDRLARQVRQAERAGPPTPLPPPPNGAEARSRQVRPALSLPSDEQTKHGIGPSARPLAEALPVAPHAKAPSAAPPRGPAIAPPRGPSTVPPRGPSTIPPPLSSSPPLPAPPRARLPSTIPPAPPPRSVLPSTPRQGGPQVVVLPPSRPLTMSLPNLSPSTGAVSPYRPQRIFLPPPPPRPPTPQGQPRAELPNPLDAGAVLLPNFVPPSAAPLPRPLPAAKGLPETPPKPLVRPNELPRVWQADEDDELPTRLYDPWRASGEASGERALQSRRAKAPKKESPLSGALACLLMWVQVGKP